MTQNTKTIFVWNINECPADSSECIFQMGKILNTTFASIIVVGDNISKFPENLSDAATTLPVSLRCGDYGIYDTIVDVLSVAKDSPKYNCVLATNNFGIWFNLFQKVPPINLVIISKTDPRQSISFSFLPQKVKCSILQWPSLKETVSNPNGIELVDNQEFDEFIPQRNETISQQMPSQSNSENEFEEDTYEPKFSSAKKNTPKVAFNKKPSESPSDRIKPLINLEKHQIDLRSPKPASRAPAGQVPQKTDEKPKEKLQSKDQSTTIPLQYQPLIEAMKSIGKSMISLSDLEEQFSICCKNLNLPPQDLQTIINSASSSGLIIYDASINYVRFKNRTLANASITYI